MFRWMYFSEDGQEVAVERGGIWHARISEQQRKYGSQRDPQYHPGDEMCRTGSAEALDEEAGDEGSVLRFTPGDHSEEAGLQSQVDGGDSKYRETDATGNIFFRVAK